MWIDSKIFKEGKKVKIKSIPPTPRASYTSQNLRLFFPAGERKKLSVSGACHVWCLKDGAAWAGEGGQAVLHESPSNTSQRGFQKARPINAYIVSLLCTQLADHFAQSVHRSFLLAPKVSGFHTHSVWKNSKIKKDVVWSVEVLSHIWKAKLREMKRHIYQVSMGDSQV